MFTEYGELSAQFYEVSKPVGTSLSGDIEFYTEQLNHVTGSVLEAGVGTGRMLIPLLQRGIAVDGVDLSEQMLDVCKQNLQRAELHANLYEQDLTTLTLPKQYEAIIMPSGSLNLLPGREALEQMLSSFKTHLQPGGQIIVDMLLPINWQEGKVMTKSIQTSIHEGIVLTSTSAEINWERQYTIDLHKYEKWRNGQLLHTELSQFTLHWYGVQEFKDILTGYGFTRIHIVPSYNGANPDGSLYTFIAS